MYGFIQIDLIRPWIKTFFLSKHSNMGQGKFRPYEIRGTYQEIAVQVTVTFQSQIMQLGTKGLRK